MSTQESESVKEGPTLGSASPEGSWEGKTGQRLPRREMGEKTSQLILRVTPGLEPEPGSRKGAVRPAKCPEA